MTEEQIKHMAEKFLNWPLPTDFNPDGGVSYDPKYGSPVGTNVLTYSQALVMVRHMVRDLPDPAQ